MIKDNENPKSRYTNDFVVKCNKDNETNKGISEGKATLLSTLYSIDANDKEKTDRVVIGNIRVYLSLKCLAHRCSEMSVACLYLLTS